MGSTIFISYSSMDKRYCDELLPHLRAVAGLRERVWRDREEIDVGDHFHPAIQEALADSRLAIVLVSDHVRNSDYVMQHELPVLLRMHEAGTLTLGLLYVSSLAEDALRLDLDGSAHPIDLKQIHSFNKWKQPPRQGKDFAPDAVMPPLDLIKVEGQRNHLYARVAEWAASKSVSTSPPASQAGGTRHELAVFIEARADHWQHQFFPGPHAGPIKPQINCLTPAQTIGDDLGGDELFQLLFGNDPMIFRHLFALAFASGRPVEPSYAPLRLRLFTGAEQLHRLPWQTIAYQQRPLSEAGWTVEFQVASTPGFPEYVRHLCHFPGRLLLAGSARTRQMAHFDDLQRFFQRHWPENPAPVVSADAPSLRGALRVGSTRLLYYYGPASRDGLLLGDGAAGERLTWDELADELQRSQSVSLLFLNLVGDFAGEAPAHGERLLAAVKGAVLFQCNPTAAGHAAARAGLACLDAVLVGKADPVVALHRNACGLISAWTRYTSWQTDAPKLLRNPDLVNLLLDRHRQRDTLAGARDEFYTYTRRRIHHVVALGTPGCRTREFPSMIRQHLVGKLAEREVYFEQSVDLSPGVKDVRGVDELVRRRYRRSPQQALLDALLDPQTLVGVTSCFLVLGWQAGETQGDAADRLLLRAVADWCRTRLAEEVAAERWQGKVRVISIVALEAPATEELAAAVGELIDAYDADPAADKAGFHFAELDALSAVRLPDLRKYFRNEAICGCDDRYRDEFPALLLGNRPEMPFDEAVGAIRRGEPDNWGSFRDELKTLTGAGAWPPAHYEPNFWSPPDAD